jgi:hypothetical protein
MCQALEMAAYVLAAKGQYGFATRRLRPVVSLSLCLSAHPEDGVQQLEITL